MMGLSAAAAAANVRSKSILFKGINYDTGTEFAPGMPSLTWAAPDMQYDLRIIKNELGCNAINIFGRDVGHLCETAAYASETGLTALVQSRLFHAAMPEVKAHILQLAEKLETLRRKDPRIILNIGCELSIFMQGIIPGNTVEERIASLSTRHQDFPAYNATLNKFLESVCAPARKLFKGKITYASGSWEQIDWKDMDYRSVNYYLDENNSKEYAGQLRKMVKQDKPLLITEFGCCSFKGADKAGAGGHGIIDWKPSGAEIRDGYERDEKVQAAYLEKLIRLYREEQVTGVFPYVFSNAYLPHSADPKYDLDMAGYGIVKTIYPATAGVRWERKEAFRMLAGLYKVI